MIRTIGVMIGGYILVRCVELACRSEAQYSSPGARSTVVAFAVIGATATGLLMIDIILSVSNGLPMQ